LLQVSGEESSGNTLKASSSDGWGGFFFEGVCRQLRRGKGGRNVRGHRFRLIAAIAAALTIVFIYCGNSHPDDSPPDRVSLISPANHSTLWPYSDTLTFLWHKGAPNVTNYWFQLAPDSLFQFSIFDSLLVDTTKQEVVYHNTRHYYWKVKARNIHGWGEFSEVRTFNFSIAVIQMGAPPDNFRLDQNYPNPFNPSTTIRYGLPNRSHVTLSVYNTLGQQVVQLVNGEMEAGLHEVRFDAATLSSGVYFYRIQAGMYVETKGFALTR
jgi:hypothetical protein